MGQNRKCLLSSEEMIVLIFGFLSGCSWLRSDGDYGLHGCSPLLSSARQWKLLEKKNMLLSLNDAHVEFSRRNPLNSHQTIHILLFKSPSYKKIFIECPNFKFTFNWVTRAHVVNGKLTWHDMSQIFATLIMPRGII